MTILNLYRKYLRSGLFNPRIATIIYPSTIIPQITYALNYHSHIQLRLL